jgi:hypothetical protein
MSDCIHRYHGELKGKHNGVELRINVFADNKNELFTDLSDIELQVFYPEITGREVIGYGHTKGVPAPQPQKPSGEKSIVPKCPECGSNESMELIEFTDRKSGTRKTAWKCQECNKWYWPNGNGRSH